MGTYLHASFNKSLFPLEDVGPLLSFILQIHDAGKMDQTENVGLLLPSRLYYRIPYLHSRKSPIIYFIELIAFVH